MRQSDGTAEEAAGHKVPLTSVDFAKCIGRARAREAEFTTYLLRLIEKYIRLKRFFLSSLFSPSVRYISGARQGKRHCTIKYSMVFDHLARK